MIHGTALRPRLWRVIATVCLCALSFIATSAPSHADSIRPATVPVKPAPAVPLPPEFDPSFYAPPASTYENKKLGQIIAARAINAANFGVLPLNVDAWQVSFRSENTRGEPIVGVSTLLKPRGSTTGPRKLVSAQLAEDGLAQYCAPSYAVQQWTLGGLTAQSSAIPFEMLVVQGFLQAGYAVSIPDYQGEKSAYAAGPLHAKITLDALRAARDFGPLGISAESTMAMFGYSGGAIATGHAAEQAAVYAPELPIVAAAEGGVPADLGEVLNASNGQATSALILGAVIGLTREYPYFKDFLEQRLDPASKLLVAIKQPFCLGVQAMTLPFLNLKGMLHWPHGDPLTAPPVARVIDETKMGKRTPKMPMYIWNSNPDEVIPVGQVNTLVKTYCKDPNARVTYTRDHFSEHVTAEVMGAPLALLWLKDRLDGKPAAPGCQTRDAGSMALDPAWWPTFSNVIGGDLAALFGAAIGSKR